MLYASFRKRGDMYRAGERTISGAIQQEKSGWSIDEDTLLRLRAERVEFVAIVVRETQDIFITTVEKFRDRELSKYANYTGRGGTIVRYLPLQHFAKRPGKVKL